MKQKAVRLELVHRFLFCKSYIETNPVDAVPGLL